MSIEIERRIRVGPVEVRQAAEDGSPGTISGYAAVFNSRSEDLGGFTEEIAPGAFAETVASDDIVAAVDHDMSRVIGRTSSGTLELAEDETGLRMQNRLPNTTVGNDIAESIRRGDVAGQSFSFRTIDDEWRVVDGKPHRTLLKVRVYDVGPTTFPAYPDTTVAVRSLGEWQRNSVPAEAAAPELSDADRMNRNQQRQAEVAGR